MNLINAIQFAIKLFNSVGTDVRNPAMETGIVFVKPFVITHAVRSFMHVKRSVSNLACCALRIVILCAIVVMSTVNVNSIVLSVKKRVLLNAQ